VSPVLGVVLLVLVTVTAAAAVGATFASTPAEPTPMTELRLTVDADDDRLALRHVTGDALNVSNLRLRIHVDGEPLAHQPPVPFFAATGFRSGPTGPFNPAGGTSWRAGQRGTLRLASTNSPDIDPGDHVRVQVLADHGTVASLQATAR
jgi:flagellin-like protein